MSEAPLGERGVGRADRVADGEHDDDCRADWCRKCFVGCVHFGICWDCGAPAAPLAEVAPIDIAPKFGGETWNDARASFNHDSPRWADYDNDTYDERDDDRCKHGLPAESCVIGIIGSASEHDHEHRTGILRRLFRRAVAACEQL